MDTRGFSLALLLTGGTGLMRALLILLLLTVTASAQDFAGMSIQGVSSGDATAPAPAAWPDADSTGLYLANRSTLRGQCVSLCSGGVSTDTNGHTTTGTGEDIECKKFTGSSQIQIEHDDATIRCVEITTDVKQPIIINDDGSVDRLTVEDTRIDCQGASGSALSEGLYVHMGTGGVFQRIEVTSCEDGANYQGSGAQWLANWFHSNDAPGADPHWDGLEINGNGDDVLIQGNHFDLGALTDTGAIQINNCFGDLTDVTVNANLLEGGGYTIYCDCNQEQYCGAGSAGNTCSNIAFTNNRVSPGYWDHTRGGSGSEQGYWYIDDESGGPDCFDETHTGNVDHGTDAEIDSEWELYPF